VIVDSKFGLSNWGAVVAVIIYSAIASGCAKQESAENHDVRSLLTVDRPDPLGPLYSRTVATRGIKFRNDKGRAVTIDAIDIRGIGIALDPARRSYRLWKYDGNRPEEVRCPVSFPPGSSGTVELQVYGLDDPSGMTGLELRLHCGEVEQVIRCDIKSAEGLVVTPGTIDVGVVGRDQTAPITVLAVAREGVRLQVEPNRLRTTVSRVPCFEGRSEWLIEGRISTEILGIEGVFEIPIMLRVNGTSMANRVIVKGRVAGPVSIFDDESLFFGDVGATDEGRARIRFITASPDLFQEDPAITLHDSLEEIRGHLFFECG
jgi:hypothetical protein